MSNYAALFEDEEDIFGGSPKSKFMDVVFNANNDIVRQELAAFIEKAATMELMLEKYVGEDIDGAVKQYYFEHQDACDTKAKSLYVEIMGAILSQSE
ncbi:DUF2018 family protein [Sulfurimonas paralvinellae]|uniref:DUF2018 family protein n=1 Tax=Sulfurimonas paralvinellae TaxID=317658 RepID=A0A7M1B9N8_9BACT|nr:DUF2018 family protein [Sulfurimonas paralvinellae]QOP45452.1 DUF2018 family protein [Sulfurimonas paralvinellae]